MNESGQQRARMKRVHTMSPKAKRVLYSTFAVTVVMFLSFIIHVIVLGTSAFPGGKRVDARYFVEEHGRIIELTKQQYWLSYLHGAVCAAMFAVLFLMVLVFYHRGDLKDEYREN